ncbi:MAG: lipopolysaccharide heptosyltransferase II [Kiritimatiellae bacterium]|nr:lipopolysaccharide heptosyltransferase II [Kiritimatiellia bacterium]
MENEVLVISPNWLGDAVMAMPAVKQLELASPAGTRIVILAKRAVAGLWRMHTSVSEVVELAGGNKATFAMARTLRKRGFKQVYIFPNSFRSALIPFLARIPRRRGTVIHARALMVNDGVRFDKGFDNKHQAIEYLKLVNAPLDSDLSNTGFAPEAAELPEEFASKVSSSTCVAIIPGAARGDSKRWPFYAEAAKLMLTKNPELKFFICGSPNEAPLCEQVANDIGADSATSLAGKTNLAQFATVLRKVKLVLCNDSGGMHLASASGTPVVAMYGLTSPVKTGPLGSNAIVIQPKGVKGARAISRDSAEAIAVLRSISAEQVAEAALNALAN